MQNAVGVNKNVCSLMPASRTSNWAFPGAGGMEMSTMVNSTNVLKSTIMHAMVDTYSCEISSVGLRFCPEDSVVQESVLQDSVLPCCDGSYVWAYDGSF